MSSPITKTPIIDMILSHEEWGVDEALALEKHKKGVNSERDLEGNPPIIVAAKVGRHVMHLIQMGADVSVTDPEGNDALKVAVIWHKQEAVNDLLDVVPKSQLNTQNGERKSVLEIAATGADLPIFRSLIAKGADEHLRKSHIFQIFLDSIETLIATQRAQMAELCEREGELNARILQLSKPIQLPPPPPPPLAAPPPILQPVPQAFIDQVSKMSGEETLKKLRIMKQKLYVLHLNSTRVDCLTLSIYFDSAKAFQLQWNGEAWTLVTAEANKLIFGDAEKALFSLDDLHARLKVLKYRHYEAGGLM